MVARGNRLYDEEDRFHQARSIAQSGSYTGNARIALGPLPSFRGNLIRNQPLAITDVPHRSTQSLNSSQSLVDLRATRVGVFLYGFIFNWFI